MSWFLTRVVLVLVAKPCQGEVIVTAGEECRRFYVVLGAPPKLLAYGEIAGVSGAKLAMNEELTASVEGIRLHAGQYFGEKALLPNVQVGDVLDRHAGQLSRDPGAPDCYETTSYFKRSKFPICGSSKRNRASFP